MRFKIFDAFTNDRFQGNPTGVVYYTKPFDKEEMQRIATELAVPHTIFISQENKVMLFNSLTFTPSNELPICSQGIIAAVFALLDDQVFLDGEYVVNTALGPRKVFVGTPIERLKFPDVFVSIGNYQVKEVADFQRLELNDFTQTPLHDSLMSFVEMGKKTRLMVLTSKEKLEQIAIKPEQVLSLCQKMQIAGLSLFAHDKSSGFYRSRYFAQSLGGFEDAVTGIASGSIMAFCLHSKMLQAEEDLMVKQGGFTTREGIMTAKFRENQIFVGKSAVKTAEGKLFL